MEHSHRRCVRLLSSRPLPGVHLQLTSLSAANRSQSDAAGLLDGQGFQVSVTTAAATARGCNSPRTTTIEPVAWEDVYSAPICYSQSALLSPAPARQLQQLVPQEGSPSRVRVWPQCSVLSALPPPCITSWPLVCHVGHAACPKPCAQRLPWLQCLPVPAVTQAAGSCSIPAQPARRPASAVRPAHTTCSSRCWCWCWC
jgi:hypothetical protein